MKNLDVVATYSFKLLEMALQKVVFVINMCSIVASWCVYCEKGMF